MNLRDAYWTAFAEKCPFLSRVLFVLGSGSDSRSGNGFIGWRSFGTNLDVRNALACLLRSGNFPTSFFCLGARSGGFAFNVRETVTASETKLVDPRFVCVVSAFRTAMQEDG
jgi:hypothetical protein